MGLFMRPRRPLMRLAAGAATDDAREPAPSHAPTSTTGELERLAEMYQSGVLSDAEFIAAKARLLGA